ncbi:hypothetical protein [Niveibacterium terrae]|uniref:hypothetical protein n=1 Tax=Niveibacterium terrae TaxID=3373598 RepID=UPI003A946598
MKSRGFALPGLLIGLLIAITALALWASRSPGSLQHRTSQRTEIALRQAREALIQHAVWEDSSPGALLCPDLDNDGASDSCGPLSLLGRFPWKTVGIAPPRDGAGECLWYALSPGARSALKADSRGGTQPALNPAFAGELSLAEAGMAAQPVIAVLIAPGRALEGQMRTGSADPCRGGAAADFIEARVGLRSFVSEPERSSFNDRLLAITANRLFDSVAPRVLIEFAGAGEAPASGLRKLFANGHRSEEFGPGPDGHPIIDFTSAATRNAFPSALPFSTRRGCTRFEVAGNFAIEWLCFNSWTSYILYQAEGVNRAKLSLAGWQLTATPDEAPHLTRASR